MPMHDVHLIVHQSIDCFVDICNWQEMAGSIDHNRSIWEGRFIFDLNRKILDMTISNFPLVTNY